VFEARNVWERSREIKTKKDMIPIVSAITLHQSTFFAHRITLEGVGEDALAQSLSTARVDMNPHQVDAPCLHWRRLFLKVLYSPMK
jgi:hypothetical protein